MKIALLADIHANLPALEAVFQDIPKVDSVICAGDILGYYADVNEVCDLLRRRCSGVIRGNHDCYVTGLMQPSPERVSAYRTEWTRNNLDPGHFRWLSDLHAEISFSSQSKRVRIRHASPWDEETYLYPDSARLDEIKLDPNEFLVLGHTHYPMLRRCGEGLIINPGSVGQPRDWNPAASYAILDTQSAEVDFRRIRYDVEGLQRRLTQMGWDPGMVSILSRTR